MNDLKNNLKALKKTKSKSKAPIQKVVSDRKNNITRTTVEIDTDMHKQLKLKCLQNDIYLKNWVTQAIIEKFETDFK